MRTNLEPLPRNSRVKKPTIAAIKDWARSELRRKPDMKLRDAILAGREAAYWEEYDYARNRY